ncbi:unnamed protein product [Microthlaspi erraticum]|uniref:Uncharacterized protein n=1 Tax=Microthlaspi erraticum TaxID=1685480 RepID=A0A6D2HJB3_9BRAS|nr:unnamed protein product [Microthlaspi erraticum]
MTEYCRLEKLLPWKTNSSIQVKVYRRRETVDSEGNPAMDFILADKNRILGEKSQMFMLVAGTGINIANHQYMISLDGPTVVRPIPSLRDSHLFDFTDFRQVTTRVFDAAYPIREILVTGEGGLARFFFNPWIKEAEVMRHRLLNPEIEEPPENMSAAGSTSHAI